MVKVFSYYVNVFEYFFLPVSFILARSHSKTCQKCFSCMAKPTTSFSSLHKIYLLLLPFANNSSVENFHLGIVAHKHRELFDDKRTHTTRAPSFNIMAFDNRMNILSNDYCDRSKMVWNKCGKWRLAFVGRCPILNRSRQSSSW